VRALHNARWLHNDLVKFFLRDPQGLCNALCMTTQRSDLLVPQFDLADRMRKALRVADIGVQEMADFLGVARNTVSTWINGKIQPSTQTIRLWAIRCNVPYEWLRWGDTPGPESAHTTRYAERVTPHANGNNLTLRNELVAPSLDETRAA
jgi:transcriptional regulator with XRE-family HTH domain